MMSSRLRNKAISSAAEVKIESLSNHQASVSFFPSQETHGATYAVQLRKILLGSIPGYKIRAFQIVGLTDKFRKLDGVKETALDLSFNLRNVVFSGVVQQDVTEEAFFNASIIINEARVYTAKDIVCSDLKIVNPEEYLFTITSVTFDKIDLIIQLGEEALTSAVLVQEGIPESYILVDAVFSPIVNVSYVNDSELLFGENGKWKSDKFTLAVTTDGSISAISAIYLALKIWYAKVTAFKGAFEEIARNYLIGTKEESSSRIDSTKAKTNKRTRKIVSLEIPEKVKDFLLNTLEIEEIDAISRFTRDEIMDRIGTSRQGKKVLLELEDVLNKLNINLREG